MKKLFSAFSFTLLLWVLLSIVASYAHAVTAVDTYQAGVTFYQQGLYDQCISQENAAIALDPRIWQAYQVKGYAYFKEGNYPATLDAYHQSLQVHPDNPQLQQIVNQLEARITPTVSATPVINPASHNSSDHSNSVESEAPVNVNTTPVTLYHPAPNNENADGKIIVQIAGGLFEPVSSEAAAQLNESYLLEIMAGYAFDQNFTLGLQGADAELTYNTAKILATTGVAIPDSFHLPPFVHVPVELVGQYSIGDSSVKPYFLLGCGLAFDSVKGTGPIVENGVTIQTYGHSWTNLEFEPGVGVSFTLDKHSSFFIQTKLDMDFGPTVSTATIPAESTDNPIIMVPVEIGFNSTFE